MSLLSIGNHLNESKYELQINLEKNNYFPGDIINVLIQLIPKYNINLNMNFSYLKIVYFIKNIENWQNDTNIKETSNQTPNGINIKAKDGFLKDKNNYFEKTILSKEETFSNLNSSKNLKNYFGHNGLNITFKIQLPKEMKPSLEWYKNENIYCFSRTILLIQIPDLKLFSYNYLFIQKPQPESINNINIQKTLGKEALFFFWEKDNVKFDLYSEKDSYGINNTFPIELKIDISQLKSELNSIILVLKRKIKFMINGEQSVFLNTSDYTEDLWEEKLTLDKKENFYDFKIDIPLIDKERIINKKKLNFNLELKPYNKKILTYLIPSYSGNNIMCEYFLKIKSIFSGNNINVNEFIVNFELFHENNQHNIESINAIDKIFTEINSKIIINNNPNDKFNNLINSGTNYSLPDEDMLKGYQSNHNVIK